MMIVKSEDRGTLLFSSLLRAFPLKLSFFLSADPQLLFTLKKKHFLKSNVI